MFKAIKDWISPPPPPPPPAAPKKARAPRKPKEEAPKIELSEKEKATAAGEPFVAILKVDLDPNDINNGTFELDWNDKFLLNLIKQGYKFSQKDTDAEIVDRWFQTVCRNIALEVYEQEIADPDKRESDMRVIRQKDLGGGFSEIS